MLVGEAVTATVAAFRQGKRWIPIRALVLVSVSALYLHSLSTLQGRV